MLGRNDARFTGDCATAFTQCPHAIPVGVAPKGERNSFASGVGFSIAKALGELRCAHDAADCLAIWCNCAPGLNLHRQQDSGSVVDWWPFVEDAKTTRVL
jgi:hypothetical protein